ncbi:CBN-MAT-3 protein [Caenorhabditis brenneri]|uniref:CBN-MAT-3 protein n=1 Tax=Caenorhabditis brenneri TaxID=135651 RepID=G0MYR7_CAEBE|nr:CBN-MAT-3 protein [Caenorhabditis brenneri]
MSSDSTTVEIPLREIKPEVSRIALIKQAATRSAALPAPGQFLNSQPSPFDVSQMSGISISMIDRGKLNKKEFVAELEWLRQESSSRCFLDSELWANEILAHMPDNWTDEVENSDPMSSTRGMEVDESPNTAPSPTPLLAPGDVEMSEEKCGYTSEFARTLINNKEFRRAAFFLKKTMHKNRRDSFLHYRSLYLAYYREQMENDAEGVERKTSYQEGKSPFAVLLERMVDEKCRENEDPWLEYLMGLLEIELGLKTEGEVSLRNAIVREPRMWPAWEGLVSLISDIEEADKFISSNGITSLWFSDWFMVLVLQRFHQDSMAIQKAEQLVARGMTGIPMIITKIASCSNARHDHDQAISNFEDVRSKDPFRLTDLHLYSDSLYIRSDRKKLAQLALECFQSQKFRWETCCIVANYYAIRRDSEHAIKFFQRALRLNPGIAALWVLIGHEFMEMKNNAAACVSYRKAIEIDSTDHRGWYGLGQMYDIMKMPTYSLFYYQEAQKCKPHDSRLLVALGEVYSKINKIEDAEKCFTGAYLFGDVEGNALWNLAKLHEKNLDDHKAAQVFEVFLIVYELVTSAEEKIIYSVAFLANYFFKNDDFEKSAEYATRCMNYETLCQEGNRLLREIAKIHAREAQTANESRVGDGQDTGANGEAPGPSNTSGTEQMDVADPNAEAGEADMSEGEDELSF